MGLDISKNSTYKYVGLDICFHLNGKRLEWFNLRWRHKFLVRPLKRTLGFENMILRKCHESRYNQEVIEVGIFKFKLIFSFIKLFILDWTLNWFFKIVRNQTETYAYILILFFLLWYITLIYYLLILNWF